jgi:hypothetical protein
MGDNSFQPPGRNHFVEALLRLSQPEKKPEPQPVPEWWKAWVKPQEPPSILAALTNFEPELNLNDGTTILAVWRKGAIILGQDSAIMRRDSEGSIMLFSQRGNCDSEYGWQIDHIHPRSKGGKDVLSNLQPLNWRNNQRKKDKIVPWPRLSL